MNYLVTYIYTYLPKIDNIYKILFNQGLKRTKTLFGVFNFVSKQIWLVYPFEALYDHKPKHKIVSITFPWIDLQYTSRTKTRLSDVITYTSKHSIN